MKYLLKLSFIGTNYHGWQIQKNAVTVFSTVSNAISDSGISDFKLTGCSRTDSGVHANEFFATLESYNIRLPEKALVVKINNNLPDDISCLSCVRVDDSFHPRYDAKSKEYCYIIDQSDFQSPFNRGFSYHYPHALNVDIMNKACVILKGKHDFFSFMKKDASNPEDTVRTIFKATVTEKDNLVIITLCADGFLYNMVRIISGTLIELSEGKITLSDIENALSSRDRNITGRTLPAYGLFLNKVNY